MAYTISFRGPSFGYTDYVYFLSQVEYAKIRGESRIEASFDAVEFFYPDGMAPFVAAVNYLTNRGFSVGVSEPRTSEMLDYWEHVGWLNGIRGTGRVQRRGSTYVPLTPYTTAEDIHEFLNFALDIVSTTQSFPEGVLDAFAWSFYEISDNVLQHSKSQEPAWLQMTSYKKTKKVEFVVVDTGRGIRASLSESIPDLVSDQEAVARAVEKGITRSREGQGNGLSGTLRIASGAHGWMNLHSGRGQLRWMEEQVHQGTTSDHPGTLVTVTLPTGQPIDVSEALWGHTPIPEMSHYLTGQGILFVVRSEASHFGNRSTGEKLRHKLANLAVLHPDEPVIIDFEGADLLSASFADEFIAKLVKSLGVLQFFGRYRFKGLSRFATATVDQVIAQRLGVDP